MPSRMTIQCPKCGQPNPVMVENIIDAQQQPTLKASLLSGRLNTVRCPNCGTPNTVAAPLLYHDASKELLISFVPMELGLPRDQQDRIVGDMLKELTRNIPKESFRGYMFQPKQALTMQGLVDQILEKDGITHEMMEGQRQTVHLIEHLMQAGPDKLDDAIRDHDADIDAEFFQATLALLQHAAQEGQENVVNALLMIQERAAEISTYGQQITAMAEQQQAVVQVVAAEIEALGESPSLGDLLDLAVSYADDPQRLQALVGLVRPAFDYQFFQELTVRIGKAPAGERSRLETLRENLVQLTQMVDQQAQLALQNAAGLLQSVVNSPNPDEVLEENLDLIDDTFMAVLAANIQEAERRADLQASGRLKQIYEKVVRLLQQNMQPELRYLNELLSTESDEDALRMIPQGVAQFGPALLDIMDSIGRMLGQQGQQELVEKMSFLREAAARHVDSEPS
ncbi:MAG: CpXC domain-containing protein [Anaerolineae bacterium]|nr:CpXC domain-containing protein [Anaerolineae bacterium]